MEETMCKCPNPDCSQSMPAYAMSCPRCGWRQCFAVRGVESSGQQRASLPAVPVCGGTGWCRKIEQVCNSAVAK